MTTGASTASDDTKYAEYAAQEYTSIETHTFAKSVDAKCLQPILLGLEEVIKMAPMPETTLAKAESLSGKEIPSATRTIEELRERKKRLPKDTAKETHTRTLQTWYGSVNEVASDRFYASMTDPSHVALDSEAEFPLLLVNADDKHLVAMGATFYFNVILEETEGGPKRIASTLRFRRLPQFQYTDRILIEKYRRIMSTE